MTKELYIAPILSIGEKDESNFHLFDGIRTGVVNQLVSIKAFKVLSEASDLEDGYKGYVVNSSCSILKNQVYLLIRLIQKEKTIAHKSFEGKVSDLNLLHNQVARFVVNQILGRSKSTIKTAETISTKANQLYLLAEFNFKKGNPEALAKSKELYEQVLKHEPNFSYGHSGYAKVLFNLIRYNQLSTKVYQTAMECLSAAMDSDPENIEAYTTRAMFAMYIEKDFPKAGVFFENALALKKDYATVYREYIWYLAALGKYNEAIKLVDIALDYDPLSLDLRCSKGDLFRYADKFDEALFCYQDAFQMDPNYRRCIIGLISCYKHKQNQDRAKYYLDLYLSKLANPLAGYGSAGAYAIWFGDQELLKLAEEKLQERSVKEPDVDLTADYLFMYGHEASDIAIHYLKKMYASGGGLISVICDPTLSKLRESDAYKEVTADLDLSDSTSIKFESPDRIIHIQSELSESLTIPKVSFLYGEAEGNYTHIFYKKGLNIASHLMRVKISSLEKQLAIEGIERIHKSYLVNIRGANYKLKGNAREAYLVDSSFDLELPVSRTRFSELKKTLG